MLKHYFKIAIRSITKNKIVSIISIISFTIGLTSALLILLYVLNETSYDRYHKNRKHIYRILSEIVGYWEEPNTNYILAPTLKSNFPEIINITRIDKLFADVNKGKEYIPNVQFRSADNDIFKIFTLPFLEGDPETALNDPFSVVLSERTAREYFENQNACGKALLVKIGGEEIQLTVSGVIKTIPENSTFKADFIVPTDLAAKYWSQQFNYENSMDDWMAPFYPQTYLLLPENYKPEELEKKFPVFEKTYLPDVLKMKFHLQPLRDVYLRSSHLANASPGIIEFIYFLGFDQIPDGLVIIGQLCIGGRSIVIQNDQELAGIIYIRPSHLQESVINAG